ncbi:MAG TPA: sigma 54-interacting transcriptional regulator [Candidatus Limnocylindrales bacterium]|nr:sigma 54-interacting transcriptional regulator [Candidatus Limnocylindrales bacterium]
MLSLQEKKEFLQGIDLFTALKEEESLRLALAAKEVFIPEQTSVFEENSPGDAVYVIFRGKVRVYHHDAELMIGERGDVLGEIAVVDRGLRSASAQTLEDTLLLQIPCDTFHEILAHDPPLMLAIFKLLSLRLRRNVEIFERQHLELLKVYNQIKAIKERLAEENIYLRQQLKESSIFNSIVGTDEKLVNILNLVEQVAPTSVPVIVYGESGTGKELIARAIHYSSSRSEYPFITVNCGAIPESLLESELFGHERGSFTGATYTRIGKFEAANHGTLFLDEIGDMSLNLQTKLLRALQFGEIQRVGSNQLLTVDVRVVAATHKDLKRMIAEGTFREDLYYRLNVVTLELPPLRGRRGDIPLLINFFMKKFNKEFRRRIQEIEPAAQERLLEYDYPGNIRELENIIKRAIVLAKGETIKLKDLPPELQQPQRFLKRPYPAIPENYRELKEVKEAARQLAVRDIEKSFLRRLLQSTRGNIAEASQKAGVNRTFLYKLLSRNGLDLNQFK